MATWLRSLLCNFMALGSVPLPGFWGKHKLTNALWVNWGEKLCGSLLCACVCVHAHGCVMVCACMHLHVCVCACMHASACVCVCACMCLHECVCLCMHASACVTVFVSPPIFSQPLLVCVHSHNNLARDQLNKYQSFKKKRPKYWYWVVWLKPLKMMPQHGHGLMTVKSEKEKNTIVICT